VPGLQFDRVHFVSFPLEWSSPSQNWVLGREGGGHLTDFAELLA
jgi:hypothetical protein